MTSPLVRRALRRSLDQVRHVTPVRPGPGAPATVRAVYAEVERDFGMLAPPVALHSPAPGPLAASWLMLRDTLITPGRADRAAREVVAAAVSLGNSCPYCVAVHGAALHGLARGGEAAAIAAGRTGEIGDLRLRRLADWGREARIGAPFPAEQAPELVGVAVTFHYLNRMVNVFLDESPLPPHVPAAVRGTLMRVLGRIMRPPATAPARPAGPALLPPARLPDDLSWAAGTPSVADAFARAAAAIEAAGERAVPAPVRELVRERVVSWDGRTPGAGRDWLEAPVAAMAPAHRPAARLALLTALASYRVTDADVGAFSGGDEALVELTSWSALTAARRLGGRLAARQPGRAPRRAAAKRP